MRSRSWASPDCIAASNVDSHPATLAQALWIGENFEMLPKDDVARVQRWVDAQNEECPRTFATRFGWSSTSTHAA